MGYSVFQRVMAAILALIAVLLWIPPSVFSGTAEAVETVAEAVEEQENSWFTKHRDQINSAHMSSVTVTSSYTTKGESVYISGSQSTVNIKVDAPASSGPVFIILDMAVFIGRIYCTTGVDICIITSNESHILAQNNYCAIDAPSSNVYITGGQDLTLRGGHGSKGNDGTDSTDDGGDKNSTNPDSIRAGAGGNGGNGGHGQPAVNAKKLAIEVDGCVTLTGGDGGAGGRGGHGGDGESSRYPASGGHGGYGGNGGTGGPAIAADTVLETYKDTQVVLVSGNGGNGGYGGGGGNGGDNTWGLISCNGSSGGNGGTGGRGGHSYIFSSLPNGSAAFDQSLIISTKGNCGGGGSAGPGGDKGATKVGTANSPVDGAAGNDGGGGSLLTTKGEAYTSNMYSFAQTAASKYEMWQQGKTWTEASAAAVNAQTRLVSIGSALEQANLNALLSAAGQLGNSYWIGLKLESYDTVRGSVYSWTDGTSFKMTGTGSSVTAHYMTENGELFSPAYTNFNGGEPNNTNNNELYVHLTTDGKWNDLNNENAIGYITESDLAQRYLTVVCNDLQGNELQRFTQEVEEHYIVKVPDIRGYTPEKTEIIGTMTDIRDTVEVVYSVNLYSVTIHYRYLEDGSVAAPIYSKTLRYGESLAVESPVITGFFTDDTTVSIQSVEKDYTILVEYKERDKKSYYIYAMLGDTPVADVEVCFAEQVKRTDSTGRAQFVYTDDILSVPLQLKKDGYTAGIYDTETEYTLNQNLGAGYINMQIDTVDNPNYSIQGISCFGNDIQNYYGVINVKYDDLVPVVVQANLPDNDSISKLQLVQEVPADSVDGDDQTVTGAQEGRVRKILKTVTAGEDALTDMGLCTFDLKGTAYTYDQDMECLLYVYLYTENGNKAVVQQLNITMVRFAGELSFKGLFDEAEVSLEDTGIDFLSGVKLSFKPNEEDEEKKDKGVKPFPVDLQVKNNEVYISYNLGDKFLDGLNTLTGGILGQTEKRLNTAMEAMAEKADQKFNDHFKKVKRETKASFALSSEAAGGLCIAINGGGNVTVKSYLRVAIAGNASWDIDFTIVVIPVTVNVTLGAEGEILITGLGYDFAKQEIIRPSATVTVGANFGISAGLGTRNVSAGAFGRISAKVTLVIGDTTYFDKIVFNGEWGVYGKLKTFWKTYYAEKAWSFLNEEIDLKNRKTRFLVRSQDLEGIEDTSQLNIYDLDAYVMITEEEAPAVPDWTVPDAQVLETTAMEFSAAKIVQLGRTQVAVYFTEDLSADPTAAKVLAYRVCEDGVWSDARLVREDSTGDSEFDLIVYNDRIYLVFAHAGKAFTAADYTDSSQLIRQITNAQELTVASFEPYTQMFANFTQITTDDCYDSMPTFGIAGSQLYLAWNKNTAEDDTVIFGTNRENDIYCSVLDSGRWSQPECLVHNCNPVVDMQVANLNNRAYVGLAVDEDANLYTEDDRNLYLVDMSGQVTYVNCYGASVGYLQAHTHSGMSVLLYGNGQSLMALDSVDGKPYLFTSEDMSIAGEYRMLELSSYGLSLAVWVEKDLETEDQTVSRFYAAWCSDDRWTDPVMFYEAPYHVSDWDGVLEESRLQLLFTDSYVQIDPSGQQQITTANKLCYYSDYLKPIKSVKLQGIDRMDGKAYVHFEIKNNGLDTLTDQQVVVRAVVRSQDAALLSQLTNTIVRPEPTVSEDVQVWYRAEVVWKKAKNTIVRLYPGQSVITTAELELPDGIELEEPTAYLEKQQVNSGASSWPGDGGGLPGVESVPSAEDTMNAVTISPENKFVQPELALVGEYLILGNVEYISLRIENQGSGAGSGEVEILRQEADGTYTQVYTESILALQADNVKYYLVKLEKDFFAATYADFVCRVNCKNDLNSENNAVTVQARKLENQEATQVDLLVEAPELSAHTGSFDKNPENSAPLELDISITDDAVRYVGCVDAENAVVDLTLTEANGGKALHVTIPESTMAALSVGSWEYRFMFLTARGYIDSVYTLQVTDTTPVPIGGTVTVVDGDGNPVTGARRGQVLQAAVQDANTEYLRYQWISEGQVVAEGSTYRVDEQCLGKSVTVSVTGYAPYYGALVSQGVQLEKQERTLAAPAVEARPAELTLRLENAFHVGDDAMLYGYATENNSQAVTQWVEGDELTFPMPGEYYLFAMAPGSDIYLPAVSESTRYVLKACTAVVMDGQDIIAAHADLQAAVDTASAGQYVRLVADWASDLTVTEDLHLDLAGYIIAGTVHVSQGAVLYGMDSATDDYDCTDGYGSIANISGEFVREYQTDITGQTKRYLAVSEDGGVSFHRFYMGMVKLSLRPEVLGFGYRAAFYGDAVVRGQLDAQDAFGYQLWVTEDIVVSRGLAAEQVTSGREVTLLLKNMDPARHGQMDVHARAYLRLQDGTTVESAVYTANMRQMLELIAANLDDFTDAQKLSVKNMCLRHSCMEQWDIAQIYNWNPAEES